MENMKRYNIYCISNGIDKEQRIQKSQSALSKESHDPPGYSESTRNTLWRRKVTEKLQTHIYIKWPITTSRAWELLGTLKGTASLKCIKVMQPAAWIYSASYSYARTCVPERMLAPRSNLMSCPFQLLCHHCARRWAGMKQGSGAQLMDRKGAGPPLSRDPLIIL